MMGMKKIDIAAMNDNQESHVLRSKTRPRPRAPAGGSGKPQSMGVIAFVLRL
jgi:hypothetical protein